jgi:GAF domain-containing protein
VTLFEQGRPRVSGVSAPWVLVLDERQYDLGEGPCLGAVTDGTWHTAEDLDEDPRWPRFAVEATEQGVLSALAVPLLVRGARLGVLNFYSSSRGAFTGASLGNAQRLADTAAVLVANAQLVAGAKRLSDELQQALVSRSTVDMAKGILMARLGLGADAAFEVLRDLSQRRHVKLREVAADLVASPPG